MPPPDLPGLDPTWSRLVPLIDGEGQLRTFHVLDSWANRPPADRPLGTLLCVHGNPTWSYLWRRLLAEPPAGWRVLAPDHLGMGYSERVPRPRRLAQRVDDLNRLTDALGLAGPVVTVAHDWGGILSLGWALRHRHQLAGVVLTNTAVHQPETSAGPLLIRLAQLPALNWVLCLRTPLFVAVTTSLTWPRLPGPVRKAFADPYRSAADRVAVAEFVADVPFAAGHPSRPALDAIADKLPTLDVPALLLWGPRDPVFLEEHLRDLQERLPQANLHRYEGSSHLLPEDAPGYPSALASWVAQLPVPAPGVAAPSSVTSAEPAQVAPVRPGVLAQLEARADDHTVAVQEVGGRSISWAALHAQVRDIAAGMAVAGIRPGDRVALLIPPSIELTVALYAVWRSGAVIVVADKGLGLRGMGRALRSARIDQVIADTTGLLAAGPMRLPGGRIAVGSASALSARIAGARHDLAGLAAAGVGRSGAADAAPDDEAAVLFTSGATGPAKGVRYRHRQVRAQLELIRDTYQLTAADRIVAAFAPFALYGPALGIPSAVPDTDVTKPGTLTATALGDAAAAIGATVVFASPAALRNVLATVGILTPEHRAALAGVRLLMSAGAPIPAPLLRQLQTVLPNAALHTPYGMTEALPITDISLTEIEAAGAGDGVCVGRPLAGVEVAIAPLDHGGAAPLAFTRQVGVSGEVWVRAEHVRDSYDALWVTDQAASAHPGWHRTGDVGALDDHGRLWIQGRTVHVISTPDGLVTPVGLELRVQAVLTGADPGASSTAAAVGVGPTGTQQVVVVVTGSGGPLAPKAITDLVRAAAGRDVAAVLVRSALPVDIRHNSKVDRVAVARWASKVLAGG